MNMKIIDIWTELIRNHKIPIKYFQINPKKIPSDQGGDLN